MSAVQDAAIAMNNALLAHGYVASDQGLYTAFQQAAGLAADGFPSTHTMQALSSTLASASVAMANVPIYPWLAAPGYDGVNAPTSAQWYGSGTGPTSSSTTSTSTSTFFGLPAWVGYVVGGAALVGIGGILLSDNSRGANSPHRQHAHARR